MFLQDLEDMASQELSDRMDLEGELYKFLFLTSILKIFLGFVISEKIDEAVDAYRSDHPEKDEHFSLLANEVYSGIEI